MPATHQLVPGRPVRLADIPTDGALLYGGDKADARREFRALRTRLPEYQHRLYAEGRQRLLIVLQAMDAGGKDGASLKLLRRVNPQGVRVTSFKVPSREELAHDFLWRVHRAVPAAGQIGVFNRSHYEDVLVVRVHGLAPEPVWRARYAQINDFERLLHESGTRILKFYLHISPEEQRERFRDRLRDPRKHWKFSMEDLEKAKEWDAYREAYEEALTRCTTEHAPWHVIPADRKWYRDLAIMRTVIAAFEDMNPAYPPLDFDPAGIVV